MIGACHRDVLPINMLKFLLLMTRGTKYMELRKPFSYQTKREFRQFIVRTKQILSLDILSG